MKTKHKIYLLIGYGEESETFIRSRKLWTSYLKNNYDVTAYFNTLMPEVSMDIVVQKGDELAVGCKGLPEEDGSRSNYDTTFVWNNSERVRLIHRRLRSYEYLLSVNDSPFWVLNTTVTSAISLSRLVSFLNSFECSNFFAGAPIFKEISYSDDFFVMLSGAGMILSSDLLQLMVDRKKDLNWNCLDDVWVSLILSEIPRTFLKRYDFTTEMSYAKSDEERIKNKIKNALLEGHMHFRVKNTTNPHLRREDIDPRILKQIFDEIECIESVDRLELSKLIDFHTYLDPSLHVGALSTIVKLG